MRETKLASKIIDQSATNQNGEDTVILLKARLFVINCRGRSCACPMSEAKKISINFQVES